MVMKVNYKLKIILTSLKSSRLSTLSHYITLVMSLKSTSIQNKKVNEYLLPFVNYQEAITFLQLPNRYFIRSVILFKVIDREITRVFIMNVDYIVPNYT